MSNIKTNSIIIRFEAPKPNGRPLPEQEQRRALTNRRGDEQPEAETQLRAARFQTASCPLDRGLANKALGDVDDVDDDEFLGIETQTGQPQRPESSAEAAEVH